MTETAREREWRRWFRFPVDVAFTAEIGEDVSRRLLSADELELAAAYGPLDEESRVEALSEEEFQAELAREQAEADEFWRGSKPHRRPRGGRR